MRHFSQNLSGRNPGALRWLKLVAATLLALAALGPTLAHSQDQSQAHAPEEIAPTPIATPPVNSAFRIDQLRQETASDPYDAEAWTQLGVMLAQEQLFEEARSAFVSALQAAPAEPGSHLNLGVCLLRMERFQESLGPLGTFLLMSPDGAQGYALLGQAHAGAKNMAGARAEWLKGAQHNLVPENDRIELLRLAAQSHVEAEEFPQAATMLVGFPDHLAAEAGQGLREIQRYSLVRSAQTQLEAGEEDEALKSFAAARAAGETTATVFLEPTEVLLGRNELAGVEALAAEASEANPAGAIGPVLLAKVAVARGDAKAAAEAWGEAARRNPKFPGVHAALGEALASIGDVEGARRALNRAVAKGEGGFAASYNMGVVLSKEGKFAEAIPHLEKALKADRSRKDGFRALGIALRKTNRHTDAARIYAELIESFGPDGRDLYQLAYNQTKAGNHAEAVKNYNMVTALEPTNANAWYNLGNSQMKLGKYSKAVAAFQSALIQRPGHEPTYYNLGLCFQKMGNFEMALENYEAAIDLKETYRSYVNAAICLQKIGEEDLSNEFYAKANALRGRR